MFSKSCEYGLQATLYMATKTDKNRPIALLEIAKNQKIPSHFLSKILQKLVRVNYIKSIKGPNGGFYFRKDLHMLSLRTVVETIDGKKKIEKCVIGYNWCSEERPCPVHAGHVKARNEQVKYLDKSLATHVRDIRRGKGRIVRNLKNGRKK